MAEPSNIYDQFVDQEKSKKKKDPSAIYDAFKEGTEANAEKLLEADFEPGKYASPGLRWSLARGDNMEEKQIRLKRKYPEGEIDTLPQSTLLGFEEDALVWRESPQSQWKLVEPQGFDWFDIPEAIAPSAEAIVGETAMAIGSGGASVPVTVFRQSLGALAGEIFEQATQYATGKQDQNLLEASGEVVTEGGLSAIGGFATSPFVAMYNVARGAGALRVGDEGIDILRAAGELDDEILERMTPGLVTDNPALVLSEAQSSALLPGMQRRYRELVTMIDSAVRSGAPGNSATAMDQTVTAFKDFNDYFLRRLPVVGTKAGEGGRAIKEGIEQYAESSRKVVKGLYDKARTIQEPEFDLQPALDLAKDLRAGAKGQLDPAVDAQITALRNIKGPIQLENGNVLSVTDQIRNIRTELWSLKHVEPGSVANQKTGQANDLYKELTEVLESPKNTDEVFQNAWKSANTAARERLTTLEKAPIVAFAKTESPAKLARTYMQPGNVDELLAIRGTVSAKQWEQFQDAAYSELLRDPENLFDTLKSYDQETLDALMPRDHQEQFFKIGKELKRIFSVGIDEIRETQVKNRNFIDTLINEADPQRSRTLIRAANNTNNRAMRESLRAGIVEWAWDGVVVPRKGGLTINENLLKRRVDQLKRSGMWSVLSGEEKRIISNAQTVSRAFQRIADAGTSIQAAEAVSQARRLQARAIYTFVSAGLVAEFYTSKAGRRILIGGGLPNSNGAMLRLLGGTLATTLPPEDISSLIEEED